MFLSIGSSLRRGFGIRLGFRMRGWTAIFGALFALMFYLCWWSILGAAYLMYGMCYVVFYLPIKGITKAAKNRQRRT